MNPFSDESADQPTPPPRDSQPPLPDTSSPSEQVEEALEEMQTRLQEFQREVERRGDEMAAIEQEATMIVPPMDAAGFKASYGPAICAGFEEHLPPGRTRCALHGVEISSRRGRIRRLAASATANFAVLMLVDVEQLQEAEARMEETAEIADLIEATVASDPTIPDATPVLYPPQVTTIEEATSTLEDETELVQAELQEIEAAVDTSDGTMDTTEKDEAADTEVADDYSTRSSSGAPETKNSAWSPSATDDGNATGGKMPIIIGSVVGAVAIIGFVAFRVMKGSSSSTTDDDNGIDFDTDRAVAMEETTSESAGNFV